MLGSRMQIQQEHEGESVDTLCKYGSCVGHLHYWRLSGSWAANTGTIVRNNIMIAIAIYTLNPISTL